MYVHLDASEIDVVNLRVLHVAEKAYTKRAALVVQIGVGDQIASRRAVGQIEVRYRVTVSAEYLVVVAEAAEIPAAEVDVVQKVNVFGLICLQIVSRSHQRKFALYVVDNNVYGQILFPAGVSEIRIPRVSVLVLEAYRGVAVMLACIV